MKRNMEEDIIRNLNQLYKAPAPKRKEEFIKGVQRQLEEIEKETAQETESSRITWVQFLCQQIPYIRKWNWLLVITGFLITLLSVRYIDREAVWTTAAFVPFLALAAVSEGSRSTQYGMEELELASRFSLKSIAASRLLLMGVSNLVLLVISILIVGTGDHAGILFSGAVIMIPYLMTAFVNFFLVRRIRGRESIYACLGATVLISGTHLLMGMTEESVYSHLSGISLLLIFVTAAALTVEECVKFMRQSEEYVWS